MNLINAKQNTKINKNNDWWELKNKYNVHEMNNAQTKYIQKKYVKNKYVLTFYVDASELIKS